MTGRFGLAHLSAIALSPPELIRVAARVGFGSVGLRLIAVTAESPGYPLMEDAAALRETRAAMADTGVRVSDVEFVRITPELDVAALEPFVAAGAALGARHVIAAPYDPDLARLADRLAALDEVCGRHAMSAVLEFFPWTAVATVGQARAVAEATGREGVGVLVDALHLARSGGAASDLAALPPGRLPFLHACDAAADGPWTREALLHTAREERLPPGEGGIDLRAIAAAMPPGCPVVLEVPMEAATRAAGVEAVLRRVHAAASRVFGEERG